MYSEVCVCVYLNGVSTGQVWGTEDSFSIWRGLGGISKCSLVAAVVAQPRWVDSRFFRQLDLDMFSSWETQPRRLCSSPFRRNLGTAAVFWRWRCSRGHILISEPLTWPSDVDGPPLFPFISAIFSKDARTHSVFIELRPAFCNPYLCINRFAKPSPGATNLRSTGHTIEFQTRPLNGI